MAKNDFELYVDQKQYAEEVGSLKKDVNKLEDLASRFNTMKDRARDAWGDEDENLTKARNMCDTAIKVIQQRIKVTQGNIKGLEEISSKAETVQKEMGEKLDEADAAINALLK